MLPPVVDRRPKTTCSPAGWQSASGGSHGLRRGADRQEREPRIASADSEPPVAFLEIKSGPHSGDRLRLSKERMVIGRHQACDVVIDLSAVSRQHAAVTIAGGEFFIEDLRSRNGTMVNGRPLS